MEHPIEKDTQKHEVEIVQISVYIFRRTNIEQKFNQLNCIQRIST